MVYSGFLRPERYRNRVFTMELVGCQIPDIIEVEYPYRKHPQGRGQKNIAREKFTVNYIVRSQYPHQTKKQEDRQISQAHVSIRPLAYRIRDGSHDSQNSGTKQYEQP